MDTSPEASAHPPSGPLALEWRSCEVPPLRAGVEARAKITVRNAGTVTWKQPDESERGIWLSFHWLDRLDNPIIWEGLRTPLPHALAPNQEATLTAPIRGPSPPGPYRLAFDLVDEGRCWFEEVGNQPLQLDLDVGPRLLERTLEVEILPGPEDLVAATRYALDQQEEPIHGTGRVVAHLAPGCQPAGDWSRRLLDSHDAGYAVVGGSVRVTGSRLLGRETHALLRAWAPPFGRAPNWRLPLVCPSLAPEVRSWIPLDEPIAGLPAIDMTGHGEPWLCDGRIRIDLPIRAVRQADRQRDEIRSTRARAQP